MVIDCCCMYKRDEETIDHLLMHRPVARELWNLVFSLFGVLWVMPMGLWILQQAGQGSLTDIDMQQFGP